MNSDVCMPRVMALGGRECSVASPDSHKSTAEPAAEKPMRLISTVCWVPVFSIIIHHLQLSFIIFNYHSSFFNNHSSFSSIIHHFQSSFIVFKHHSSFSIIIYHVQSSLIQVLGGNSSFSIIIHHFQSTLIKGYRGNQQWLAITRASGSR